MSASQIGSDESCKIYSLLALIDVSLNQSYKQFCPTSIRDHVTSVFLMHKIPCTL